MGADFDANGSIVGARVACDLDAGVEQPHGRLADGERQGLSHERMRDGVLVAVEADVGRLAGGDGPYEVAIKRVRGERDEPGALVGEEVADGALVALT